MPKSPKSVNKEILKKTKLKCQKKNDEWIATKIDCMWLYLLFNMWYDDMTCWNWKM